MPSLFLSLSSSSSSLPPPPPPSLSISLSIFLQDLPVDQLSIPYLVFLTYAHTRFSLSFSSLDNLHCARSLLSGFLISYWWATSVPAGKMHLSGHSWFARSGSGSVFHHQIPPTLLPQLYNVLNIMHTACHPPHNQSPPTRPIDPTAT